MRVTVFHGTKQRYVQAGINDADLDFLQKLGFVDSVEKIKDPQNAKQKN